MQQKYYCPNCGARIVCGERFCIGCGINFTWVVEPIQPQPTAAWYGYQYPGQHEPDQAWPMHDQQPRLWQNPGLNGDVFSQRKSSSACSAVAPISAGIAKLLADFERHIRYKKAIEQGGGEPLC